MLVRISAAKRLRDAAERSARLAGEARVSERDRARRTRPWPRGGRMSRASPLSISDRGRAGSGAVAGPGFGARREPSRTRRDDSRRD